MAKKSKDSFSSKPRYIGKFETDKGDIKDAVIVGRGRPDEIEKKTDRVSVRDRRVPMGLYSLRWDLESLWTGSSKKKSSKKGKTKGKKKSSGSSTSSHASSSSASS